MKKAISYISRLFGGSLRPVLAVICGYAAICGMCCIFSRLVLSGVIPYEYITAYSAASEFFGVAAASGIFGRRRGKIIFNAVLTWAVMMAGIMVLGAVFFEGGLDPRSAIFISAAALSGSLSGCILSNLR